MSFHNMRAYGDLRATGPSRQFDAWLAEAVALPGTERAEALAGWAAAPGGRFSHPREEHLILLMVAAGASEAEGRRVQRYRAGDRHLGPGSTDQRWPPSCARAGGAASA